jgi:hypothetical protein
MLSSWITGTVVMPFVNMWSVLPFLTVPLSVVMDSHETICQRWSVLPSVVWNEFSNAYSQNKSAEMPLVQGVQSTCPSQTPLVEEGVHRRCSQMPFAEIRFKRITKSRLEPYNYISCLEQPSDPPTARTTNFQQPTLDPSLVIGQTET